MRIAINPALQYGSDEKQTHYEVQFVLGPKPGSIANVDTKSTIVFDLEDAGHQRPGDLYLHAFAHQLASRAVAVNGVLPRSLRHFM